MTRNHLPSLRTQHFQTRRDTTLPPNRTLSRLLDDYSDDGIYVQCTAQRTVIFLQDRHTSVLREQSQSQRERTSGLAPALELDLRAVEPERAQERVHVSEA